MEETGVKLIRDCDGYKIATIIVGNFCICNTIFEKISIAKNENLFIVWIDSRTKLVVDFVRFVYEDFDFYCYAATSTDEEITSKLNDWLA